MFLDSWLVDSLGLLGTCCLAAVFALAAGTKLRDTQRARAGLHAFGVPERWTQPALAALVTLELLVAALLLYPPTSRAGAWAALAALALFTVALARLLLLGRRPSCACFGALSDAAISWNSVARNLALLALAAWLLARPDAVPTLDTPRLAALLALGWIALSGAWLLQLTRQNGRLLLRIQQLEQAAPPAPETARPAGPLPVGAPVPALGLSDALGRPLDLRSRHGSPLLLLFLDATCSHCRPLLEQLRRRRAAGVELVVISESAALHHDLPGDVSVLVDPGRTAAALLGVRGTPAAVSIDPQGRVAQPPVHGTSPVRAVLDELAPQEVRHELAPV